VSEEVVGGVVLGQDSALPDDRDPVAELDRLVDVVGDEDHGLPHLVVQAQELELEAISRDRVEGAERLVHEHQRRVGGERARQADALALATRELRGIPLRVGGLETHELEQLGGAGALTLTRPAEQARNRGDVVGNGHVREEPDLLDHIADPAAKLGDVLVTHARSVDPDIALVELDQAVDHLHRRRLPGA
jgi:hypothetical protein